MRSSTPLFGVLAAGVACLGCGQTIETLHPVTLQQAVREPSRIPPAEVPAEPTSDRASQADGAASGESDSTAAPSGAPPKRTVVAGVLEEPAAPSLMEIAQRERQRRREAPPPMARIDDKNLERRAQPPQPVRTAAETPPARTTSSSETGGNGESAAATRTDSESYWRDRVYDLRLQWRELEDRKLELEREVNGLRRDFYEEDDPYYRDSEIKPAWDRAWRDLQETDRQIELIQVELDRTLEDGRRSGALPGWLREGIELEPEPDEDADRESMGITDAVEPTQVNRAAEIDE